MNPARWRQVEELYQFALEQPAALRLGFLAQACGGDQELQHKIEALLAQSVSQSNLSKADHGGFLDRPAWENAPRIFSTRPHNSRTDRNLALIDF